jgi:hypothetical protein
VTRRADRRRIAELEAANAKLTAETERLRAHLELATAIANDMLGARLAEGFAKDAAAAWTRLELQQYGRSLHVYGASVVPRWPGVVSGL